jgi:glutathione-specific gamma-glutamylcyclotransferase
LIDAGSVQERLPLAISLSRLRALPTDPHILRPLSQCKVYVGETDNPSFGGGLPMLELAERIASSIGPSGPNKVRRGFLPHRIGLQLSLTLRVQEYLYRLCDAIRGLGKEEDAYLNELERLTRAEEQRLVKQA